MNAAKTEKVTVYKLTLPSGRSTEIKKDLGTEREPDLIFIHALYVNGPAELRTLAKMLEDVADDMEDKKLEDRAQFFPALGGTLHDEIAANEPDANVSSLQALNHE